LSETAAVAVAVLIAAIAVPRVTVMSLQAEPELDPESREWMDRLRSAAAERDAVLARLACRALASGCSPRCCPARWWRLPKLPTAAVAARAPPARRAASASGCVART
jgi:hypothetical protein